MLLETKKEEICINQIIGNKVEMTIVEGDIIVNDIKPDILNIVSVEGTPYIYKKEIIDNKVRLDGNINTYILYLADDVNGSTRSLNTTLDFTQVIEIENYNNNMKIDEKIEILNFDTNIINSRKVNLKANIQTNIQIYSNEQVEIINNIDNINDIQILNNTVDVSINTGEGKTIVYAKDTIAIDSTDNLVEILNANLNIINKDVKVSYNKVLAKADVAIKILYLTEDNRICCKETKIPVMGFIEIPNVSDNNICDTKYKLKNFIVKPNNSENHSIYIEAEIEIECCVYEKKEINIIEDMYSTTQDINCKKQNIDAMTDKQVIKEVYKIREQINDANIENAKIHDVKVNPKINSNIKKNRIIYDGEIELNIIMMENNNITNKKISMPFNFEIISSNVDETTHLQTQIDIKEENFVVLSDRSGRNIN